LEPKVAKKRKRVYVLIAIMLVFCTGLTAFFYLQSTALLTKDDAIQIAMPYIEQYAKENNRTIESVGATFYETKDTQDERGGQTYPCWEINAGFIRLNYTENGDNTQYYINGYSVGVWADTREIRWSSIMGFY